MFLFFDTETTGLPKNWKAPATDINNWPRMVQIAWILSDGKGKRIDSASHIIKPENFIIPSEASKVHRISTEKAISEGKDLTEILKTFNKLVSESEAIVAHNISFDEKIIGAEFIRKKLNSDFGKKDKVCTMKLATDYCKIPGYYGYKWPTLSELHIKLFGEDFEEAHDAFADIEATKRCFWEMKKRNLL